MKSMLAIAALLFTFQTAAQADMKEKRMEKITEELKLTPDQQKSFAAINEEFFSKMKALKEEHDTKVNALLTEEQRTKFAKMQEHRQNKLKDQKK